MLEPQQRSCAPQPKGLGGWLTLVFLGMVLSVVAVVGNGLRFYVPWFREGAMAALTRPDWPYDYSLDAVWLHLCVDVGIIVGNVALIVMFFMRSRWFPRLFIAANLINVILAWLSVWGEATETGRTILECKTAGVARSMITATIWIWYMLVSTRVRNTFCKTN